MKSLRIASWITTGYSVLYALANALIIYTDGDWGAGFVVPVFWPSALFFVLTPIVAIVAGVAYWRVRGNRTVWFTLFLSILALCLLGISYGWAEYWYHARHNY